MVNQKAPSIEELKALKWNKGNHHKVHLPNRKVAASKKGSELATTGEAPEKQTPQKRGMRFHTHEEALEDIRRIENSDLPTISNAPDAPIFNRSAYMESTMMAGTPPKSSSLKTPNVGIPGAKFMEDPTAHVAEYKNSDPNMKTFTIPTKPDSTFRFSREEAPRPSNHQPKKPSPVVRKPINQRPKAEPTPTQKPEQYPERMPHLKAPDFMAKPEPVSAPEAELKNTEGDIIRYQTSPQTNDSNFVSVMLPSKFIPYEFKELWVRPFNVDDIGAIAETQSASGLDFTKLVDTLNNAISCDVRDLTLPDFFYLLYWERLNSYLSSPFEIHWTSRYGNANITTVTQDCLITDYLEMSESEYAEYYESGLRLPTVRDSEVLANNDMSSKDKWFFQRAQFLVWGDTPTEKIQAFKELGANNADIISIIDAYDKSTHHGVREVITCHDMRYEPKAALAFLENEVKTLKESLESAKDKDFIVLALRTANEYIDEINDIREKLSKGENPLPKEEEQEVPYDLSEFFPGV